MTLALRVECIKTVLLILSFPYCHLYVLSHEMYSERGMAPSSSKWSLTLSIFLAQVTTLRGSEVQFFSLLCGFCQLLSVLYLFGVPKHSPNLIMENHLVWKVFIIKRNWGMMYYGFHIPILVNVFNLCTNQYSPP